LFGFDKNVHPYEEAYGGIAGLLQELTCLPQCFTSAG